jgi:hypothetical protein
MDESDGTMKAEADRSVRKLRAALLTAHSKFLQKLAVAEEQQKPDFVQEYLVERFDTFAQNYWGVIAYRQGEQSYEQMLTSALAEEVAPLLSQYAAVFDDLQWASKVVTLLKARESYYLGEAIRTRVEAEKQLAVAVNLENGADGERPRAASWDAVEIRFLSDHKVQIKVGDSTYPQNYAEMGFEDGRTKNPNKAWETLRLLGASGTIRAATTGRDWAKVEKRVQEIRKVLKKHFRIHADPVPFIKGTGYRTCFKIGYSPSFNT